MSTAPVVDIVVPTAAAMLAFGRRLSGLLWAGDLVLLTGDLGAGKTTLTRGLGEGLRVRGAVTSPTFVIARVHPSLADGPPLVHVDAYRLSSLDEVDDLDLDASLEESVTVVEWGEGKAEGLSEDRLEVRIRRSQGDALPSYDIGGGGTGSPGNAVPADGNNHADPRTVTVTGVGPRWRHIDMSCLA